MKSANIFECRKFGVVTYKKSKNQYNILAWSDSNESLWGGKRNIYI